MRRSKLAAIHSVPILAAAVFMFYATAALAGENQYSLPGHGSIELTVPEAWSDTVNQPPGELPPTIVFQSGELSEFQVLVTPIWGMSADDSSNSDGKIRALVLRAASESADSAVEQTLPLQEFVGPWGNGYYFFATDRAPKPGEFLYMTQGALAVDDLTLVFTILTKPGADEAVDRALRMVQGARRNRSL